MLNRGAMCDYVILSQMHQSFSINTWHLLVSVLLAMQSVSNEVNGQMQKLHLRNEMVGIKCLVSADDSVSSMKLNAANAFWPTLWMKF